MENYHYKELRNVRAGKASGIIQLHQPLLPLRYPTWGSIFLSGGQTEFTLWWVDCGSVQNANVPRTTGHYLFQWKYNGIYHTEHTICDFT